MSDEGRLVAGRYRVIKRIGTGAMGAVWQAHDDVLHRTVAIKQLLLQPGLDEHEAEDARQRTMREGRIAARLHHPNAITVFDVVTDDNGQPCLIMEYLASTSLAQELQRRQTLPPLDVARIGAQVASALKEAHAVGIVHRDIKPGNVLLADNGLVKITDFGISRATDDVTVTKTGMIAGTPAYLAPEVAVGGNPGPESDVFSLGSTLYAAAEGQPPFGLSENTLGLLHAVAAGQINPPRRSGPLTSVLAVMLHPDIAHRPTAQECEELLSAVARGETPIGGPAEEATRMQRGPHQGGSGTAVLGAAGAGAAGGALGAAAAGGEAVPSAHSGSLDGAQPYARDPYPAQGHYDDEDDPPTTEHPRADYDDDDYYGDDRYGDDYADGYAEEYGHDHDEYDDPYRGGRPAQPVSAPTRAVPAGAAPYGDFDDFDDYERGDYGADDYDYADADDRGGPHPGAERAADEPEPKGNWKIPAAIGGVVIVGMTAFVLWLFGGSGGNGGGTDAEEDPLDQRQVATTTNIPSPSSTRETTSTTESDVRGGVEPQPTDEVDDPGNVVVEPTDRDTPEPPDETPSPTGQEPPPESEEESTSSTTTTTSSSSENSNTDTVSPPAASET